MSSALQPEPKTMHCSDFLARYTEYDDSLVTSRDLSEFRRHMEECASCARYDRVLRKGRMLARQIPPAPPSPDFIPKLETALEGTRPGAGGRPSRSLAAAGVAAAALLLMATTGPDILDGSRPANRAIAPHPSVMAEAVPTVEPAAGKRALRLPPAALEDPSTWTTSRVDRRVASSYSPLVIGPPAYRAPRPVQLSSTLTPRPTLD